MSLCGRRPCSTILRNDAGREGSRGSLVSCILEAGMLILYQIGRLFLFCYFIMKILMVSGVGAIIEIPIFRIWVHEDFSIHVY